MYFLLLVSREIYTTGKNSILPPAVTALTNLTSAILVLFFGPFEAHFYGENIWGIVEARLRRISPLLLCFWAMYRIYEKLGSNFSPRNNEPIRISVLNMKSML